MHRRPQSQAFCPISPEPCKFEYFKSAKTHAFPRDSEFFTGDELLIPTSGRRIAAVILRIAAPEQGEALVREDGVCVTQSQLAEMANVSRNLANTALVRMRESGWIETGYNRLKVIDRPALAAFAYGED